MAEKENNYKKMDLDDLIADCEVSFIDCQESMKFKKTSKSKRQHQKMINFFGSVTEYLKELETIKQGKCRTCSK